MLRLSIMPETDKTRKKKKSKQRRKQKRPKTKQTKRPKTKTTTKRPKSKGAGIFSNQFPTNRVIDSNQYWQLRAEIAGAEGRVAANLKDRQSEYDRKEANIEKIKAEVKDFTSLTPAQRAYAASIGTPANAAPPAHSGPPPRRYPRSPSSPQPNRGPPPLPPPSNTPPRKHRPRTFAQRAARPAVASPPRSPDTPEPQRSASDQRRANAKIRKGRDQLIAGAEVTRSGSLSAEDRDEIRTGASAKLAEIRRRDQISP